MLDLLLSVYQHLQHKAAHLSRMSVVGSVVVHYGYVFGTLQQSVEIVGVYSHLVVYGSESVSLTYGVGNERRVVDTLRHIALVARKQQQVLEVKITCFEHTHYLNTYYRFTMKRNCGRRYQLLYESAQCINVYIQVAIGSKLFQSVYDGIHSEYRLLQECVFRVLGVHANQLDNCCYVM